MAPVEHLSAHPTPGAVTQQPFHGPRYSMLPTAPPSSVAAEDSSVVAWILVGVAVAVTLGTAVVVLLYTYYRSSRAGNRVFCCSSPPNLSGTFKMSVKNLRRRIGNCFGGASRSYYPSSASGVPIYRSTAPMISSRRSSVQPPLLACRGLIQSYASIELSNFEAQKRKLSADPGICRASSHLTIDDESLSIPIRKASDPESSAAGSIYIEVPTLRQCRWRSAEVPTSNEHAALMDNQSISSYGSSEPDQQNKQTPVGTIRLVMTYTKDSQTLAIDVDRVSDLILRRRSFGKGSSSTNVFVRVQLLPHGSSADTKAVAAAESAVFNESCSFNDVAEDALSTSSVRLSVFTKDDNNNVLVGLVSIPLEAALVAGHKFFFDRLIFAKPKGTRSTDCGELLVSLYYQPAAGKLSVIVLKARNLPKMDFFGLSDPYVKIYLKYNGLRVYKKKTQIVKKSLNPVFNESFVFNIQPYEFPEGMSKVSLELVVTDWDRLTKNDRIGTVRLGEGVSGSGGQHWREICQNPRKQVARWHTIEPGACN